MPSTITELHEQILQQPLLDNLSLSIQNTYFSCSEPPAQPPCSYVKLWWPSTFMCAKHAEQDVLGHIDYGQTNLKAGSFG